MKTFLDRLSQTNFEVQVMVVKSNIKQGDSLLVKTKVTNVTDQEAIFCDYHTPFEGIINHTFRVKKDNREIPYQGIMASRVPPRPDNFIKVKPGQSIDCEVSISFEYDLSQKGTYTISYIGTDISGLPDSEEIEFYVD